MTSSLKIRLPKELMDKVYEFTENKYYYKRMVELTNSDLKYSSYMNYKRAWQLLLDELKRKDLKGFLKERGIVFQKYITNLVDNAEDWLIDFDEEMVLESINKRELVLKTSEIAYKPPGHMYYYPLGLLIPLHLLKIPIYDIKFTVYYHYDDTRIINVRNYKYNRLSLSQLIKIYNKLTEPFLERDTQIYIAGRRKLLYWKHICFDNLLSS